MMTPETARLEHDHRTRKLRRLARRRAVEPPTPSRMAAEQQAARIRAVLPELDVTVAHHDGETVCVVRPLAGAGRGRT